MTRYGELPVHSSDVFLEIAKGPASYSSLQSALSLSPTTLLRILKFLKKRKFIKVVDIRFKTYHGIRKTYHLTDRGKKVLPLFKKLAKAEGKIFDSLRSAGKNL